MDRIEGDLIALALAGKFDVIIHGCNCFHTMGAGIARVIRARFPEAYEADRATDHGTRDKLGTISSALITRETARFQVVNAYTQHHWKGTGVKAEYPAIRSCFETIARRFDGARIGYPLIGAGLAGGDWAVIEPIIDTALAGQTHTLVVLL